MVSTRVDPSDEHRHIHVVNGQKISVTEPETKIGIFLETGMSGPPPSIVASLGDARERRPPLRQYHYDRVAHPGARPRPLDLHRLHL